MKKNYFAKGLPLLLTFLSLLPFGLRAQTSWHEAFAYTAGTLKGRGGWVDLGYDYSNPVQVAADPLAYEGYAADVPANSVALSGANGNQNVMTSFIADAEAKGITTGDLFASMLVRVNSVPAKASTGYFFSFLKATAVLHNFTAGSSPYDWGRLFLCPGSEEGKFQFGISYYKSTAETRTADLETGKTYHVVLRVAINENGDKLDNFYLYVNPAGTTELPSSATIGSKGSAYSNITDDKNGYGMKGVALWQKMGWNAGNFSVNVADLRVADSYAGLFGSSAPVEKAPVITPSATELDFAALFTGDTATKTLNIKAKDLKGDITLSSDNAALTPSATTINAADAQGADGVNVTLTLKPTAAADNATATLTLSSEGAEDVKVAVKWAAVQITEVARLSDFYAKDPSLGEYLRYTGKAVVSFADKTTSPVTYYLQDETGGIQFKDDYEVLGTSFFEPGDALTGMIVSTSEGFGGVNYIFPSVPQSGLIASSHNNVSPVTATLAEIKASPATYVNRVVLVKGAKLSGFEDGAKFAAGMAQPTISDASEATGKLRIFKGTTLIGTDIPAGPVNLVGLSTSASAVIIAPRAAGDITEAEEEKPGIALSTESFLKVRGQVGSRTEVGVVHVKATAMKDKVTIAPSYGVRNVFSTDVAELPAGTSETDVKIYYTPDAVAKHNGYIYFNVGSDLIAEVRINAMATDPATPPALTIDPAEVEPFKTEPGTEVKATVKVTPVGLPDFVNVRLVQEGGAFLIGTTMLSSKGEQPLTITFRPQTAGTYEGKIIFSSEFFDDVTLPISGTAAKAPVIPEDQEGDALPLSKENPLTELSETFGGATSNKPLSLEGWKNLAVTGKRAWWGYTFPDTDEENAGENAAKVTAYDSKVEEGGETPCQMLLVTPALDYLNSKTQIFAFRVMGKFLTDDMAEKLELCYIYTDGDGTMHVEPIKEVEMPAKKDDAGVWRKFEVNLEGQNLDDVFFMGFRYTGTRGASGAATYYIDNVTYGHEGSTSGVSAAKASGKVTGARVFDLTGRALRTAAKTDAAACDGLPAGTYLLQISTADGRTTVKKVVKK